MPTLDNAKNHPYVAKSQAKKRAEIGDEKYRRIEAEQKRIYRGKKKAANVAAQAMINCWELSD